MKLPLRVLGVAFALLGILLLVCPAQAIAPLAAPANLKASVQSAGGKPVVALVWSPVPSATSYVVFRDGKVYGRATTPSFADAGVQFGQKHVYSVSAFQQLAGWWSSRFGPLATITLTVTPPAPTGLAASSLWVPNCPLCHVAMAHIFLTWNAVGGAQSYSVYRGGTLLCSTTTAADTDMAVTSGQTYTYTVTAVTGTFVSPQSAPVSATAANPPVAAAPAPGPTTPVTAPTTPAMDSMPGFTAPANLRAQGVRQNGSTDTLTWDAVPGADSYNVYQYGALIAKAVTGTSFTVPVAQFNGAMTYSVTAVDSGCNCESIPSGVSMAMGALDPTQKPGWMPSAPVTPTAPVAKVDWNGLTPRITVSWTGDATNYTYNVYRDGVLAASNLWRLYYIDGSVAPGSTHTYTVTGVNVPWTTPVESAPSAPVTATALTAAPAASGGKVQITGVVPGDDSALVSFAAVPGAADYAIYDATNPGLVKYSGGSLSIQWNGINPATGAHLVVEAVDKLGPFQTMDGTMGPGATAMSGAMNEAINGQGDPSNLPNVLASSDPFPVTCQSQALTGDQAFFDDFTNDAPLTPSTLDPALAALSAAGNGWYDINEVQTDKWRIRTYNADTQMSKMFIMNNHFMDTLYDGPTASNHPFSHNNNASMVMMPKATADITGGKTLHVTFEVDAHFDDRRWCDVFVAPAGDPLMSSTPTKLEPGQTLNPTGNDFVWQITSGLDYLESWNAGTMTNVESWTGWNDQQATGRNAGDPYNFNGTMQDLDKRHKFDMYLSQNRYRVLEDNIIVRDVDLTKVYPNDDGVATADAHLQWWTGKVQVYFVHEVYHTGNDRNELVQWGGGPACAYWCNYRPYADERHWDDMGFEVLPTFPQ